MAMEQQQGRAGAAGREVDADALGRGHAQVLEAGEQRIEGSGHAVS